MTTEQMLAKINELEQQLVEARNDARKWEEQALRLEAMFIEQQLEMDDYKQDAAHYKELWKQLADAEKLRLDEARKAATWRT